MASISGADITLEANEFTNVGADVDHFEASDVVWLYQEQGDVSSRTQYTILSIAGNVVTLSGSPGYASTGDTLLTGGDYDQVQASQRKHVHIGDASAPPVLSIATTTAFKYV